MVGKKLVSNLVPYLSAGISETLPVYAFDQNEDRKLPCLIVGYDRENLSSPGLLGHYTVSGFVYVAVQGYTDTTNNTADNLSTETIGLLCDSTMYNSLNAPVSGSDLRPCKDFHIHRLFIQGTERMQQESSSFIAINFDAYCVNAD